MRHDRLDRLARLTQGAALVGIGLFDVACNKEPVKPEEPHINATAMPMPMPSESAPLPNINATATPPPADTADAGMAPRPHTINATATPPPSFRPPAQLNAPTKPASSH